MLRLREAMKKEQAAKAAPSAAAKKDASNGTDNAGNHASITEIRLQKGLLANSRFYRLER